MSTTKTSKGYIGMSMEGPIATWYAESVRKDPGEQLKIVQALKESLPEGGNVLEVAPGPGILAIELARSSKYRVTGLDISKTFVEIARKKATEAGVSVDFRLGNASEMPFGTNTFDRIACQAAFKNFSEPVEALNEMYRVLKPGGKAVIHDLRRDVSGAEVNNAVNDMGLNTINTLLTKMVFKTTLLRRAYTRADFQRMIAQSHFTTFDIQTESISLIVWLTK